MGATLMFNPFKKKPFEIDDFAKLIIAEARKAGIAESLEYDPKSFVLKRGEERTNLVNLFNDYSQANDAHKKRILGNALALLRQKKQDISFEEAKSKVAAAVREQALFSFTTLWWELEGGKTEPTIAFEPISAWFTRCLVLDFPEYVAMVTLENLKIWGISFYKLFEIGLARLRDHTVPKFQQQPGFYMGGWHDDYDNSRILIPGIFGPLRLDGHPVVCLPNRNLLLVTGSENHDGIKAMLKHAEEIVQTKPRPMNPAPLILKDGEVADFSVTENSPIFNDVERAKKISALIYYQQQAENLMKLYAQKGKDLFVASYTLNQGETGGYESFSVWSKTVATLLPKTDFIAFFDPTKPESQRPLGLVKWDDVLRIAGDLLLDTQMFPARFYVSKFPTDEQLAGIIGSSAF
jgi:hypothetical protein